MKPYRMTKNIGGVRFGYATHEDLLSEARRRAKEFRSRRYLARVTKEKSMLGKIIYTVWIKRK